MIVLASKSPRRKELMKLISVDFITFNSDIDEDISYQLPTPLEATRDISLRKALKAKEAYPNDIILSADTIVVLNNEILHKPINEEDAYQILKKLSNKTHEVITAYTIINKDKILTNHVISYVTFYDLDDSLIHRYIKSGSPLDKAGAYGIQDKDYPLVKSYEGSYDNIVGFPVKEIKEDLKRMG